MNSRPYRDYTDKERAKMAENLKKDFLDRDKVSFVKIRKTGRSGWESMIPEGSSYSSYLTDDPEELIKNAYRHARNMIIAMNLPQKVKVIISKDQNKTNGRLLFVATEMFDDPDMTAGQKIDCFTGAAVHEGSHVLYTDFEAGAKGDRLVMKVTNILEDERIERLLGEEKPGLANFLTSIKYYYFDKYAKKTKELKEKKDGNDTKKKELPLLPRILNAILKTVRYPKAYTEEELTTFAPLLTDVQELLTPYPQSTAECNVKAAEIMELVRKMMQEMKEDEVQEEKKQEGQQGQDGEPQDSDRQDDGDDRHENGSQNSENKNNDSDSDSDSGSQSGQKDGKDRENGGQDSDENSDEDADGDDSHENGSQDSENEDNDSNSDSDSGSQGQDDEITEEESDDSTGTNAESEDADEDPDEMDEETVREAMRRMEEAIEEQMEDVLKALDELVQDQRPDSSKISQTIKDNPSLPYECDGSIEKGSCEGTVIMKADQYKPTYMESYNRIRKHIPAMSKALRCHGTEQTNILRGLRNGALDTTKMAEAYQSVQTVFTRKTTSKADSISICVLIDESGSMCGNRITAARDTAILLKEATDGIRNLNISIYGYSGYYDNAVIIPYMENGKGERHSLGTCTARGSTPTAKAIHEAVARTRKRPEEKGLIIVLSDGSPDESTMMVREETRRAEKKGFSVIGISISPSLPQSELEQMYGRNLMLTNLSTLAPDLGKLIKHDILKKTKRQTS